MNHPNYDSYRQNWWNFLVLLKLHIVLFKLLLLWTAASLMINSG